MASARKRKRTDACSTYLEGKSRKAHKLRPNLESELSEQCACLPVLSRLKPAFTSLVRQEAELRYSR